MLRLPGATQGLGLAASSLGFEEAQGLGLEVSGSGIYGFEGL